MRLQRQQLRDVLLISLLCVCATSLAKTSPAVKPWLEVYKFVKQADKEWKTFDDHFTYAIDVANGSKNPSKPKSSLKGIDALHARIVAATDRVNELPLPQPPVRPEVRVTNDDQGAWSAALTILVGWVEQQQQNQADRQQVAEQLKQLLEHARVTAAAGQELERALGKLIAADPITKQVQAAWTGMIWDINPAIGKFIEAIDKKQQQLAVLSKREDEYVSNSGNTLHGFLKADSVRITEALKQASKELEDNREESLAVRDELRAARQDLAAERADMNQELGNLRSDERRARTDLKAAENSIRDHDEDVKAAHRIRDSVSGYRCSEGHNWQDCNSHPDEKAAWQRKMLQKSEERIAAIEEKYRWARRNVRALREEAANLAAELQAQEGPYRERIEAAQAKLNKLRTRQTELAANQRALASREAKVKGLKKANTANLERMAKLGYR
jgi:DNA repair exonuclease SbcCD ATPase subunit